MLLDDRAAVHAGTGDGGSFEWSVTAVASVATLLLRERFEVHLCLTSDTSGTVLPVQGIDHALDELAAVQPHETTSPSGIVEALDDFAHHGGGLVVGVVGALDDDVAAMCTGRSRHGIALVIDRGGFAHGQDEGGPAGATAQQLALGGWRAQVVSPGASLPEVWARATVGMGAIR